MTSRFEHGPIKAAFAGLIDRVMPNAVVIVVAVVLLTLSVLSHLNDGGGADDWKKDVLLLLIGTVLGGLLTALGGVLRSKRDPKSDGDDQ